MSLPRHFGICDTLGCNYELLARPHYRVFCVENDPIRDFIPVYRDVFYYCPDCARHFSGFVEGSYNISSSLPEVEIKLIVSLIIDELLFPIKNWSKFHTVQGFPGTYWISKAKEEVEPRTVNRLIFDGYNLFDKAEKYRKELSRLSKLSVEEVIPLILGDDDIISKVDEHFKGDKNWYKKKLTEEEKKSVIDIFSQSVRLLEAQIGMIRAHIYLKQVNST